MTSSRVDEKAFTTLQARAALRQATLVQIDGDDGRPQYIVTKWALTKSFDSLADVERLLARMEGTAA